MVKRNLSRKQAFKAMDTQTKLLRLKPAEPKNQVSRLFKRCFAAWTVFCWKL